MALASNPQRLIVAIVQNDDADAVVTALLENDFRATRLASTGGFLRKGNTTLLVGLAAEQVDRVLSLIRQEARTRPPGLGAETAAAATVFVLDLDEYQRV